MQRQNGSVFLIYKSVTLLGIFLHNVESFPPDLARLIFISNWKIKKNIPYGNWHPNCFDYRQW